MAKTEQKREKIRIGERVELFIRKYRMVLIIVLASLFALIIGYGIYSQIASGVKTKSTVLLESLEDNYQSWKTESGEGKKAELEKSILSAGDEILKKYPRLFAAQRAYALLGDFYYEKKDWPKARENYAKAADSFGKNYLGAVSLFNAAAVAEEQNKYLEAIGYYERLTRDYDKESPLVWHALFSIGRLYETQKDYAKAEETYNGLINRSADESWTNMAKDRIIYLTARGLLKK
jgi:tetratricopeptide (TPR) repeat protein